MRDEHSSGGAVISFRDGTPFVALIATRGRTRWGLPKGAVSEGETSEQAALREVNEETGLVASIVKQLDTIEYFFRASGTLIRKRVDFYLMMYLSGELKPLDTIEYFFRASGTLIRKRVDFYLMMFTSGELTPQLSEVDDVEWVELSEAIQRASFDSERKLLEMAQQEIETARASLTKS